MFNSRWLTTVLVLVVSAAGAAAAIQQAQASQTRREPQFENDNVRVWKSIIMPNQPLTLHRHEFGRTIVDAQGRHARHRRCRRQDDEEGGLGNRESLLAGQGPAGQQHGDINRGTQPIEVIVVEMRK